MATQYRQGLGDHEPGQFKVICISDTIALVSWPYDPNGDDRLQVNPDDHAQVCSMLLKYGLQMGLPLRGAIAQGKFAVSEMGNSVVGPAVDEVAAWHEQLDWIGVHYCPSIELTRLPDAPDSYHRGYHFLRVPPVTEYQLPTKIGKPMMGECVDWVRDWKSLMGFSDLYTYGPPIDQTPENELQRPGSVIGVPIFTPSLTDGTSCNRRLTLRDLKQCFLAMGPLGPDIYPKYYNTLKFFLAREGLHAGDV